MIELNIELPKDQITEFCNRWHIRELAFFGSVLRHDFGPDSDLDILITLAGEASWSLFDHLRMEEELQKILLRKIDLFTKRAVEQSHNQLRRQKILSTAEVVYVA
ncbi:MAG: nucleotidyltransferase domain-containing protein [Chloroflexi bacterium]|nr:nucleotidyltransferase domain-containing protein [Chloroflexota bacterium]